MPQVSIPSPYAASTRALFNFMNRLVEGLGIKAGPEHFSLSANRYFYSTMSSILSSECRSEIARDSELW